MKLKEVKTFPSELQVDIGSFKFLLYWVKQDKFSFRVDRKKKKLLTQCNKNRDIGKHL